MLSSAALLLTLVIGSSLALKCWHLSKELDFKTVRDKGLVNCHDNHTYCIYQSVTAFVPRERSRYPVSLETTSCSSGWTFEERNAHKFIGLSLDNLCDGRLALPHKWDFTLLPHAGKAFRLVERLNEVRCCVTDGCNEADYWLVGGGSDGLPWYKKPFNWVRNLLS